MTAEVDELQPLDKSAPSAPGPSSPQAAAKPQSVLAKWFFRLGPWAGGIVAGIIIENSADFFGPTAKRTGEWIRWVFFGTMTFPPWIIFLLSLGGLVLLSALAVRAWARFSAALPLHIPKGQHPGTKYLRDIFDLQATGLPPLEISWTWHGILPSMGSAVCAPHGHPLAQWQPEPTKYLGCPHCSNLGNPDEVKKLMEAAWDRHKAAIGARAKDETWRAAKKAVKKCQSKRSAVAFARTKTQS